MLRWHYVVEVAVLARDLDEVHAASSAAHRLWPPLFVPNANIFMLEQRDAVHGPESAEGRRGVRQITANPRARFTSRQVAF